MGEGVCRHLGPKIWAGPKVESGVQDKPYPLPKLPPNLQNIFHQVFRIPKIPSRKCIILSDWKGDL